MISREEKTATADRLTDALAAAAAIMPPDGAHALSSPVPGRLAGPASRPVRRRMGRLRAWLVPIVAAAGVTQRPPTAADEIKAIGWTNDAILYGGQATVWLRGDDEQIAAIGAKAPSSA